MVYSCNICYSNVSEIQKEKANLSISFFLFKYLEYLFNGSVIDGSTVIINFIALPRAYPATIGYFIAICQGSQSQGLSTALHNH